MRSSTSSSSDAGARWAIRALLGTALLVGITLEIATRFLVPRIHQNQRRVQEEYRGALSLGPSRSGSKASVLLMGNSLTLLGVDLDRLRTLLGSEYRVARWVVEDTRYLDWYFGLRRIFRHGCRPDVVVVGARSYHVTGAHVRGGYFAHNMLDWTDLPAAAARTHADLTLTSEMAFANLSAFYGQREEINKKVLGTILPDFRRLAGMMAARRRSPSKTLPRQELFVERLSELKNLCAAHGARLVVWVPPHTEVDPQASAVVEAGNRAGVSVVIPVRHNEIPSARFPDGEHLDAQGALQLTEALATRLRPLLARADPHLAEIRP